MKNCQGCKKPPTSNQDYVWCENKECLEHEQKYLRYEWVALDSNISEIFKPGNLDLFAVAYNSVG